MGEDVVVAQSNKNSAGIDETDKTSTIISSTFINNIEKHSKDNCHGSARRPQIVNKTQTMDKPRKWYNFTRQHSSNANSRSKNATDENSTTNRHSWHLNDSLEM